MEAEESYPLKSSSEIISYKLMKQLVCNNLILNTETGECTCSGKKVRIKREGKMFQLLALLMKNKNNTIKYQYMLGFLEDNPMRKILIEDHPEIYEKERGRIRHLIQSLKERLPEFDRINFRCHAKKGYMLVCKKKK